MQMKLKKYLQNKTSRPLPCKKVPDFGSIGVSGFRENTTNRTNCSIYCLTG
jgi:hypothetical protein